MGQSAAGCAEEVMSKKIKLSNRLTVKEIQEVVRLSEAGTTNVKLASMFEQDRSSIGRLIKRVKGDPDVMGVEYSDECQYLVGESLVKTVKVNGIEHAWVPSYQWEMSATKDGRVFTHLSKFREVGSYEEQSGRYKIRTRVGMTPRIYQRGRVVLSAWTGVMLDTDLHCLHSNGDLSDDSLDGLRWGTVSDNMRDTVAHGRHFRQKLTYADCREIIRLSVLGGFTHDEISKEFDVTPQAIGSVLRNYREDPARYNWTEFEADSIEDRI